MSNILAELKRPIGVFGGTFDPPHLGHLILASEAMYNMGLEKVLWVLTPDPPHKKGLEITPLPLRLEMLQSTISESHGFEVCDVDIKRSPPHYAVDTIRILKSAYQDHSLVYLLGGDSLRDLSRWQMPQAFVASCDAIAVMRRPGARMDWGGVTHNVPGLTHKLHVIEAPLMEIASHEIRKRVCNGAPYRYYLHPKVFEIIQRNNLYCN